MLTHDVHSSRCDCFDSVIETYPILSFLTVMSDLYQKRLISEDDLRHLVDLCGLSHPHYMMRYSSRHWLDSLVGIQSSKSADVRARTFDTLRRYSLTEVGKETQAKPTGETIHYFYLYVCMYMHLYACICMCNQCYL